MAVTALYPGTFDPVTNGHTDLVRRACRLFDHVIVAVASNADKNPLFTVDERVAMAREVLSEYSSVEVVGFDNLLVDFVQQKNASVIIRGIRAVSDFEYEFQMAGMNRQIAPDIETVFLTPAEQHAYISASLVKEIAHLGGGVEPFLDKRVVAALKKKIS
jgi:pantetheine-phosphate adenylyltransferase